MPTADVVWGRINTLCASKPYGFSRAREPFSLDLQPADSVGEAYYVGMELVDTQGMIGFQQVERWECRIGIARRHGDDMSTAYRQLLTDVTSLQASLAREETAQDFCAEEPFEAVVPEPLPTDAFVVAELTAVLNFERAL